MRAQLTSLVIGVTMVAFGAPASLADNKNPDEIVRAQLVGFQEVPALSTPAGGQFKAVIDEDSGVITYTVSYENLVGLVQQAHIHFGQKGVNGGISVFLCSNLGNGPEGTPECPAAPAEVTGTFTSAAVIGPATQGIGPGELAELIVAIRAGVAYANVHSDRFPAGEVRGQIRSRDH